MKRMYMVILLVGFLMGCSSNNSNSFNHKHNIGENEDIRFKLLKRGYSLDYVDGYEIGCKSVTLPEKNITKDEWRYKIQKEYVRGYKQGVSTCQNPYGEISRAYWEERKKEKTQEEKWNEINK